MKFFVLKIKDFFYERNSYTSSLISADIKEAKIFDEDDLRNEENIKVINELTKSGFELMEIKFMKPTTEE